MSEITTILLHGEYPVRILGTDGGKRLIEFIDEANRPHGMHPREWVSRIALVEEVKPTDGAPANPEHVQEHK